MSNHPRMRPNGAQPQQIPITVAPQPVDIQVLVEQAASAAGPMVVLRFFTPTGQAVYFLPVENARQVADMIRQRATPVALN